MRFGVAFDPANSTGWAVFDLEAKRDADFVADSGQCDFGAEMPQVFGVVGTTAPEWVAVEYPIVSRGPGGLGRAASSMSTAWKAGHLHGCCITLWPKAQYWNPRPAEHRAIVGLGKGGNKRLLIAERVCLWVRATYGIDCGPGVKESAEQWDRANAIAIGAAAYSLFTLGYRGRTR